MSDSGAIEELEEEYEEESSELEDEDELNHRIQHKSTESPNEAYVEPENLIRSQTDPPGDISAFEHDYKGGTDKNVKRSTSKQNATLPAPKGISKSKSLQYAYIQKHSYKRDDIDDLDVQSVEDEDIMNQTISEDEQYLDTSIIAEDFATTNRQKGGKLSAKRNSTLDMVKNGIMSAKKRLLSPDKDSSNGHNGHSYAHTIKDSPVSNSTGNGIPNPYSPSTPDSNHSESSADSAEQTHKKYNSDTGKKKKSASDSLNKKRTPKNDAQNKRSSFNILSKGKGLFNRTGSNKDFKQEVIVEDEAHRKSGSKSNINSIKSKLQNIKKSYSKNNKSPTSQPQQASIDREKKTNKTNKTKKKKDKTKKDGSQKKVQSKKESQKKDSSKKKEIQKPRRRKKESKNSLSPNKDKTRQYRSASTNKTTESVRAPIKSKRSQTKDNLALKRHSMKPVRSRSQKPHKQPKRQSSIKPSSKQTDSNSARRHRNQSDLNRKKALAEDRKKDLNLQKTSYSEYGKGSKSRREQKKNKFDNFTMHESLRNKSQAKLEPDTEKNKQKLRRKSGGDGLSDKKETQREKDEKENNAIEAADKKCKFRIKNEIFELYEYYKPIRLIGSGAYAVVCEAIDERTKKRVAIKKNKHIFDDIRDARRILREIKLLLHFNKYKHPDLIEIYDTLPPTVSEIQDFEDVYIVMPLLESNLCKIITSKQKLSNLHYQYLTYQVLRGLAFIHEAGVIHRDIKPENILLNGNDCDVKIIDFGLARGVLGGEGEDNPENAKATEYVCTRWYRSPEVMCSGGQYDEKMDIWGVGCILAEMILRRPLFPGANYLDQLQQIFDVMGTPDAIEWILNDQARNWVAKLPKHNGKNLKKMMAHKFEDNEKDLNNCSDLLYKLLQLNPADRISAQDSLRHPYFKEMHDEDEILSGDKFDLSFEFEQSIKTKFGVRHMMYTALDQYHRKQWHKIKKKQKRKAQKEKEKKEKGGKDKKHRSSKQSKHKYKTSRHK